jgi:hypothetical protein
MKKSLLRMVMLLVAVTFVAATGSADSEPPVQEEPRLVDHYVALQQMQERFFQRSPEDQARLQPQLRRAERQACQRLEQERQERVPTEEYRRQGGNEFVAFVEQFEQYCQTLR